ncbi:MAG: hypothetical protein ACXV2E_07935 [Halobacteriota archaeon]
MDIRHDEGLVGSYSNKENAYKAEARAYAFSTKRAIAGTVKYKVLFADATHAASESDETQVVVTKGD